MPSMEIKNWLTALIVGILGLVLAACGVVVAYKQLRGTKRVDDVEAAHPEDIAMHEGAVLAQGSESLRATGVLAADARGGVQSIEAVAVRIDPPETQLPATNGDDRS